MKYVTFSSANKYLTSKEYARSKDKSFNFYFKTTITTSKRGQSISKFEFQDFTHTKYGYCRVFVRLLDGTLLEYKRGDRITDNTTGHQVFNNLVTMMKCIPRGSWSHQIGFTDIT